MALLTAREAALLANLEGTWAWEKTTDFSGETIATPETAGYTIDREFTITRGTGGIHRQYRNGQLEIEETFYICCFAIFGPCERTALCLQASCDFVPDFNPDGLQMRVCWCSDYGPVPGCGNSLWGDHYVRVTSVPAVTTSFGHLKALFD